MDKKQIKEYIERIFQLFWKERIKDPFLVIKYTVYILYLSRFDELETLEESNTASIFVDMSREKRKWSYLKKLDEQDFVYNYRNIVIPFLKQQVVGLYPLLSFGDHQMTDEVNDKICYELFHIIDEFIDWYKNEHDREISTNTYGLFYEELLIRYQIDKRVICIPRHIQRLMCELADLNFGDNIYMPDIGTGDLSVTAYETILSKHLLPGKATLDDDGFTIGNVASSTLSCEQLKSIIIDGEQTSDENTFLATMNFYFHGDSLVHNITTQDLLSSDFVPSDYKYEKIIAAPLCGSLLKNPNIDKELKKRVGNNSSAMYIDRCLKQMKDGGRLVLLTTEGFLFAHDSKVAKYREHILDSCTLEAVISLPTGVLSYTAVKTSILVISKKSCSPDSNVWFCELKNDGYSLNAKRLRNSATPLPQLLDNYKNQKEETNAVMDSFKVSQAEIKKNGAVLVVNFYNEYHKPKVEQKNPQDILLELKDIEQTIMVELDKLSDLLES